MIDLTFHVATPNRWGDLQRLFGPNGAYSGCWCMYLRESAKEFDANCTKGGAGNKARLKAIVKRGDGARTSIDIDSRQPAAEMWHGSLQQLLKAGFHVALRRKPARPIVRRVLD